MVDRDRRRPPHAWIRWDRIRRDWEDRFLPRECAARENVRLAREGEQRRVSAAQISRQAYIEGWMRKEATA